MLGLWQQRESVRVFFSHRAHAGAWNRFQVSLREVAPDPPILLYKGYDFGDLLDTYGTLLPTAHGMRSRTPTAT